jgi:hypothetical protein
VLALALRSRVSDLAAGVLFGAAIGIGMLAVWQLRHPGGTPPG